ncbi:carbonic anhydrase family protein [Nonomuraea longicatena]|uniref:carbonic anhydrase n=1 Tax=Nonomuraea longicatena TaxID=83682 RepID=A0ABP4APF8_9ACTN
MLSRLARLLTAVAATAALIAAPAQAQFACTGVPGHVQSPVEIDRSQNCGPATPAIEIHYNTADGVVQFRDKNSNSAVDSHDDIAFVPSVPGQYIRYGGIRYDLTEVHYHFRAEHKFAGEVFAPAEAHFVHRRTPTGKPVVLGVLLDGVATSAGAHQHILENAPPTFLVPWPVGGIDVASMLPANKASYRYYGSLTSDPYTDVDWVVFNDRLQAKSQTIGNLHARFGPAGNKRGLQPVAPRIYHGHP